MKKLSGFVVVSLSLFFFYQSFQELGSNIAAHIDNIFGYVFALLFLMGVGFAISGIILLIKSFRNNT